MSTIAFPFPAGFPSMSEPTQPSTPPEPDATPRDARAAAWRWLERALFLVAFLCLGSYAYVAVHARVVQHEASERLDESLARQRQQPATLPGDPGSPRGPARPAGSPGASAAAAPDEPPPALRTGDVVGRLEVPRVGVSVMVLEGDDDDTLRQAAGHIPDTDLPGAPDGNVGIAGHRDTFFRPLMNIRKGDEIRLTTEHGAYRYEVDSIRIVTPEDVAVLDPVDHPVLTLVTCYPFYYVGHAPNRFIVQAREIGAAEPSRAGS
jgi:sortase A